MSSKLLGASLEAPKAGTTLLARAAAITWRRVKNTPAGVISDGRIGMGMETSAFETPRYSESCLLAPLHELNIRRHGDWAIDENRLVRDQQMRQIALGIAIGNHRQAWMLP